MTGALAGRLLGVRAYTVWPSVEHPQFAADVALPAAATWLQNTFGDAPARRIPGPATWSALRARGLLWGRPSRLVTDALAGVRGTADGVRLALYSPTGQSNSKIACFVFARGSREPDLVVKAMPERRFTERLRHETEIVEALRDRLGRAGAATDALPLAPLLAGIVAGDYVVVQVVDPLASATGAASPPDAALRWLRAFQEGTTRALAPWSPADTAAALDAVRDAWGRARPRAVEAVAARAGSLLRALEGVEVRRCGVHGDFWRGNLAQRGARLRVYDWEWARAEGTPFFDLWTWELGPLRRGAERGDRELLAGLSAALARVRAELHTCGVDERFGLATLAPSLGELTFRVRRATGVAGGAEAESALLMDAAAELLG